jgi:hypothetical protein
MKRDKTRPFTAPRASKPVETGHRNYNAEWGKRIERQLAQIEKKQTSVERKQDSSEDGQIIVQQVQSKTRGNGKGIKMI